MINKDISESLRILIPVALFVMLTVYLLMSDSSIVGPL